MTTNTNSEATPSIPTVGTPAYWTAQREAFELIARWRETYCDPYPERDVLRAIAAHGFASRVMAAHGYPVARWLDALDEEIGWYEARCEDGLQIDPCAPDVADDW